MTRLQQLLYEGAGTRPDYLVNRDDKKLIPPSHSSTQVFGFWFLVCYAAAHLANQSHQTHIQVVRSNKVARKRLTESNGTPAIGPWTHECCLEVIGFWFLVCYAATQLATQLQRLYLYDGSLSLVY